MRVRYSETRFIKANTDVCYKEASFSGVQNLMSSAFFFCCVKGTIGSVHN